MTSLVIAEHDNQTLNQLTLNTISAAQKLGDITVLVAGNNCQSVADQVASISGISTVLHCDDASMDHALAESLADLVVSIAADYSHILASATTFGKNLMPRVAALLDVAQISEIIEVVDEHTFKRPIYAGNAIATVRSSDAVKIITVRGTAFDTTESGSNSAPIETISHQGSNDLSSFVSHELTKSDRPELSSARVVISGGRGLGSAENFEMLEKLADKLGAAIGASRAAVDAGYVPNDYQVGQTGKIVAPDLYIAVAISGAIQHLAGMKDSKVIVAINTDEDAPIFQIADYGLVADCFEAIPQLVEAID